MHKEPRLTTITGRWIWHFKCKYMYVHKKIFRKKYECEFGFIYIKRSLERQSKLRAPHTTPFPFKSMMYRDLVFMSCADKHVISTSKWCWKCKRQKERKILKNLKGPNIEALHTLKNTQAGEDGSCGISSPCTDQSARSLLTQSSHQNTRSHAFIFFLWHFLC